jgi:putative NADH-flavin reductase
LKNTGSPFQLLEPEVAGGWGPNTRAQREKHPPVVTHLHYEFQGWSGDDLLETFPEFVVTERLAHPLERSGLTGFELAPVEVSPGDMWEQLYGDRPLPQCRWLKITARAGEADFGKTDLANLVVSPAAFALLKTFSLDNCAVRPWSAGGIAPDSVMRVLIIGATGGTGRELVAQALERGHRVTAFVRDPDRLQIRHERLTLAQGNVLDYPSLEGAVQGQDAVLSALGHKRWFYPNRILSTGTRNLIRAMTKHRVRRLVCETALGIGDSRGRAGLYYSLFVAPFILPFYFGDKERQEAYIRASTLDWVIVRPGMLTNGLRQGVYRHGPKVGHWLLSCRVSRADVADFMLRQLTDDSYLRSTPGICG